MHQNVALDQNPQNLLSHSSLIVQRWGILAKINYKICNRFYITVEALYPHCLKLDCVGQLGQHQTQLNTKRRNATNAIIQKAQFATAIIMWGTKMTRHIQRPCTTSLNDNNVPNVLANRAWQSSDEEITTESIHSMCRSMKYGSSNSRCENIHKVGRVSIYTRLFQSKEFFMGYVEFSRRSQKTCKTHVSTARALCKGHILNTSYQEFASVLALPCVWCFVYLKPRMS